MLESRASLRGGECVLANVLRLHQMRYLYVYILLLCVSSECDYSYRRECFCGEENAAAKAEERLHSH